MSDWKQAEKTAQPVLNLVDSCLIVDDSSEPSSPVAQLETSAVRDEFFAGEPSSEISQSSMEEPVEKAPANTFANEAISPGPEIAAPSGAVPPDLGERYQVLALLGEGGMGTVWKVFDRDLQETFAVKVLRPELATDETLIKRFAHEAKLACELTHANIAAIFGPCFDKQGHPGVIMRYVEGESLAELLAREGKLSVERTTFILRQLCDALAHSHMKGIVHRDIKPSNIIIAKTEDGSDLVQLVDFGIAQSVYTKATVTQALTRSVDVLGSPSYMSPEQFLGKEITAKSDIYSLGCVVYEMLTGAPPFVDENPVRLVLKHLNEAPDLLKLPESMRRMVSLWLEKEPSGRPASFDESRQILDLELPFHYGYESRIPVILSLLAFLTVTISYLPVNCYALAFFMLSTAFSLFLVNYRNASRSHIYTRLEYSFLATSFCVFLYAVIWNLFQRDFAFLRYLVLPLFIWSNSSGFLLNSYCKLKQFEFDPSHRLKSVIKPPAAILRGLLFFVAFYMGLLAIVPVFTMYSCRDFGFRFLCEQLDLALSLPYFFCFFIGLCLVELFFCLDFTADKVMIKLKQFCVAYVAGLSVSAISLAFYLQPGMVELVRQQHVLYLEKSGGVSTEVLNYPHGYYYNQARIDVAFRCSNDKTLQRKICEQILADKTETDYFTKAVAYSLLLSIENPYIDDLPAKRAAYIASRSDFDQAVMNMKLELAASERGNDTTSLAFRRAFQRISENIDGRFRLGQSVFDFLPVSSITHSEPASCMWAYAYNIAGVALSNRDIGRAREAIALAKAFSGKLDHRYDDTISDLEERLSRLEKNKSPE